MKRDIMENIVEYVVHEYPGRCPGQGCFAPLALDVL